MGEQEQNENTKTEPKTAETSGDGEQKPPSSGQKAWGYDMYPERQSVFKPTIARVVQMKEGREYFDKQKCEENVYHCIKKSPLVKLMTRALRASGWWDFFS